MKKHEIFLTFESFFIQVYKGLHLPRKTRSVPEAPAAQKKCPTSRACHAKQTSTYHARGMPPQKTDLSQKAVPVKEAGLPATISCQASFEKGGRCEGHCGQP